MPRRPTHDRHRCPQGSEGPDHGHRRRVRRPARAGVAALGRSAPARALVGAADLPGTTARVTIEEIGSGRTRMSIQSRFPSPEAMEQVLAMGVEEGLKQAVGQIDAILAEDAASPATMTTHTLDVPGAT